jgi:hypothetical protein
MYGVRHFKSPRSYNGFGKSIQVVSTQYKCIGLRSMFLRVVRRMTRVRGVQVGGEVQGKDHPDPLQAMGILGVTYRHLGRRGESEPSSSSLAEKNGFSG